MSNSSLVSYTKLSPNCSKPRNHAIDTITIHHMAGNLSVETCGAVFAKSSRQASSNYGIGSDGRVGLYVEERNRAWTSGNRANDHRAITIEVANDDAGVKNKTWTVSASAYKALIKLVADICKRNGIKKLVWDPNKTNRINHTNGANMTLHKDFAATGCPGPYLESKMPEIAKEVNAILAGQTPTPAPTPTPTKEVAVTVTMPIVKNGSKNRAVRVWQSILDIVSTGVFDDKTEQYTKEWQKKNGLTADGVVGPATWTKGLNSL